VNVINCRQPVHIGYTDLSLISITVARCVAWRCASHRNRIDAFLRKSKRLGYCDVDMPPVTDLFATADDVLLSHVMSGSTHVLQRLLPYQSNHHYNLRNRRHQLYNWRTRQRT